MERAIDADILLQEFDDMEPYEEYENEHDLWLDMRMEVLNAPTLTPPNEPLTLDSRLTPAMVTCPKGRQGVRDTRFYCPGCKKAVKKGEAYCHKCGQALIFPIEKYDKENNKIWLDFSNRRPPEVSP